MFSDEKKTMPKKRRDQRLGESTTSLVGFFVTPTEKRAIELAKPADVSMSEFCRSLIMRETMARLNQQIRLGRKKILDEELGE